MTTAEQIIAEIVAEHTPMHDNGPFGDDPWTGCAGKDCADWPGGDDEAFDAHVAAHVVAALTNAGKTIVELPEVSAGDITIGVVSALHDYGVIDIETSPDFVRIFESTGWYSAEAMTFLGSALIAVAAARVAEGGA